MSEGDPIMHQHKLLLPFDCLLEVSRFLPLKFKVRLGRSCKTLSLNLLRREYLLNFEMFKFEIFNNSDKSKFRLERGGDTETELLFLAKNCVLRDFKDFYDPGLVSESLRENMLEYFAYKCTAEKADMVLAMITTKHYYTELDNIRIICTPNQSTDLIFEGKPRPNLQDHDFELSNFLQLDLSKDNSLIFRKWLKAWVFKSKGDFVLVCSKAPPLSDLMDLDDNDEMDIELDMIPSPYTGEEQIYRFAPSIEKNPLLLQIRFNYAAGSGDVQTCSQILAHPLIPKMGLSPFLFRSALESGREPIINLFTNNHKFQRLLLPFYIKNASCFYSDPTLKITEMIKSGRFDLHLADNHCLYVAATSRLEGIVDILLQDPMVMSSRNWPASPLRILYDSSLLDKVKAILSKKITSTGIEKSIFRKSIQHGHKDLVEIFLRDKSDMRFDPCLGNSFKLVRFSVKYPLILKDLLSDPRSSQFPIMELVPQFPRISWSLEVLQIITGFVEGLGVTKPHNYFSLFKICAAMGSLTIVKKILNTLPVPDKVLSQGLDAACFNGNGEVVTFLLTKVDPKPHNVVTTAKMGHSSLLLELLGDERLSTFDISILNTNNFDERVNRIIYGFENKKWAERFDRVMEKVLPGQDLKRSSSTLG